jgi:serine/threonine-protein kinase RsbT
LTDSTRLALERALGGFVGEILARSMVALSLSWSHVDLDDLGPGDDKRLSAALLKGIRVYVNDVAQQRACVREVEFILLCAARDHLRSAACEELAADPEQPDAADEEAPVTIPIRTEDDVVLARSSGRDLCRTMGFSSSAQVKLATAISELARNIVQYAGEGSIRILRLNGIHAGVEIEASDEGPGILDPELVMSTQYRSRTGMGIGLKGARRLADEFWLDSAPGSGTRVVLRKYLD